MEVTLVRKKCFTVRTHSIGFSKWEKTRGVITIEREPGIWTPQNCPVFKFQLCLLSAE